MTQTKPNLLAAMLILGIGFSGIAVGGDCVTHFPESTPDSDFDDLGDGTVRHKTTGLLWKKCLQGWSGDNCETGAEQTLNWQEALQAASTEDFAGHTDWRLPNKNELLSIVENRCYAPSINSNIFPNTDKGDHWTSTPMYLDNSTEKATSISFQYGDTGNYNISGARLVRLVRGGR